MASTNVRISIGAHETLRRLARAEHVPIESVLERAVEQYRREKFVRGANADFAALQKDRKAWAAEVAERRLWERTLADGVKDG